MKEIPIENFLRMNPQIPQFSQKNTNFLIAGANPISYLDDGTQEKQIAPLSASIDWAKIPLPSIIDSYSESKVNYYVPIYAGNSVISGGQSFTNTLSTYLKSCKFYIKKLGTPTGTATATIYAHSGTYGTSSIPTGSPLATSDTFDISTLTTSLQLVLFKFTGVNQILLSANTHYVIVLNSNNGDISNNIQMGTDRVSSIHSGNFSYSADDSSWTARSTYDAIFYVYGGSLVSTTTPLEGNIVHMVASIDGYFDAYAITDTTKVFGLTTTDIAELGYPNGTAYSGILNCYLAITGGILFAVISQTAVYKMTLPSSVWTSFGYITNTQGAQILEPFLDFIALSIGTVLYSPGRYLKKVDVTAFTISDGLDLGLGWGIFQMRNYNNKYLAISAGQNMGGYPQNYIFLWDGSSSRYNYSIKVPGKFLDMKVIDSVLYVVVQVASGKNCLYYLYNNVLRKVFTIQISTIDSMVHALTPCSLFDFKNYVGISLDTISSLLYPMMIYGKDEVGELEFIHSYGRLFDQKVVSFSGNLFANEFVPNENSNLYYLPSSGTYQQIFYKSQWIPVKNLQAIDIYYETPPSSGTDAINVTIYGQGEDILSGSSTTVLASITPTSHLTNKRHRLDVKGFTGSQVMIQLSTINSTWRPIIRGIVPITK